MIALLIIAILLGIAGTVIALIEARNAASLKKELEQINSRLLYVETKKPETPVTSTEVTVPELPNFIFDTDNNCVTLLGNLSVKGWVTAEIVSSEG